MSIHAIKSSLAAATLVGLTTTAQAGNTNLIDLNALERCMVEGLETVLSTQQGDIRDVKLESFVAQPPNITDFHYVAQLKTQSENSFKRISLSAGVDNIPSRRIRGYDNLVITASYDNNLRDRSLAAVFSVRVNESGMQNAYGEPPEYSDITLLDYKKTTPGHYEVSPEDRTKIYDDILDAVASVAFFTSMCLGQDAVPADVEMIEIPDLNDL